MIPIARNRSTRRRRRIKSIPFKSINRLALDAAVASSVTTSVDGVTQWADLGPNGNHFVNDHAAGSQPGYNGVELTFDGSDHLHNDGRSTIPQTGGWTVTFRARTPNTTIQQVVLAQFLAGIAGRISLTTWTAGQWRLFWSPMSADIRAGSVASNEYQVVTFQRSGDGELCSLRVDGVLVGTRNVSATDAVLQTGNLIGANTSSGGFDTSPTNHFTGGIQRIGVWSQAFSGGDLVAIENWTSNGG